MEVQFNELNNADFVPENKYLAGTDSNSFFKNEPIKELFKIDGLRGIGNQSGIRRSMSKNGKKMAFMVLVNRKDQDIWPNKYYSKEKKLIYYGDNKKSNNFYLDTKQQGNKYLEYLQEAINLKNTSDLWPIFYFEVDEPSAKDYRFKGLAFLNKVERVKNQGIENLKCTFSIDNTETINRKWLRDLKIDNPNSMYTPEIWSKYLNNIANNSVSKYLNKAVEFETKSIEEELENFYVSEGKKVITYGTRYERNPKLREKAIQIHGNSCQVCQFSFEKTYGEIGKGFIEVHHIKPLYMTNGEQEVNPVTDLIPVCPNCHRMIHRKKSEVLSIEELKETIALKE